METDRGQALREAIMAGRKGGTLSALGVYGLMDKFPMGVIMNKGMTVRSARQHGQAYLPRLLEHAQRGELNSSYLATRVLTRGSGELFGVCGKGCGVLQVVQQPQ